MQIAIIGAGIIGSTTAIRLQEQFGKRISLTIFSEEFSPFTTGDISVKFYSIFIVQLYFLHDFNVFQAGLWGPYQLADTPQEKIL